MAAIEFRTLGSLELRRTDKYELHSLLAQPKRLALLAYLCLAKPRGFQRRDALIAMFWPESDASHARTSLRNALHGLRRSLGESALLSRGDEEVGVDPQAVWCDAADFERRAESGDPLGALELYRGDLLAGFFVDDVPSFERWLEAERERYRAMASRVANAAAATCESSGDLATAVSWARRAVELAELDEPSVRALMELLEQTGDRASALQAYETFARRIASELDALPSPTTRAVANRLRGPALISDADSIAVPEVRKPEHATSRAQGSAPSLPSQGRTIGGNWLGLVRAGTALIATLVLALAGIAGAGLLRDGSRTKKEVRRKVTSTGNAMMASLSPDAQFLAYVEQAGDSQRVLVQDMVVGTPTTLVTLPGPIWTLEWSPDGARLLIGGYGRVLLVPRLGGQSTVIRRDSVSQPMAYWLPDGKRISMHQSGDRRVVVFNSDTQDSTQFPVSGNYTWLDEGSWSPNGRVFAVQTESADPVSWEIRSVTLDGTSRAVVKDSVLLGSPRWSRDGHTLYYARGADAVWRIPVSPLTGIAAGQAQQVAGDLEMYPQRFGLVHFAISADGRALIYARGRRFSNLWLVESGGEKPNTVRLTTGTSLRWSPVVSPNGKSIAFAQEVNGIAEIFLMPMTGGPVTQLTTNARVHAESQIAWSPEGDRIAFSTVRGGRAQVWVASVSDGKMRGFGTTKMSTATGHLTWAPGAEIAYQPANHQTIRLIDPISGREHDLVEPLPISSLHSPAYSPKGDYLAAYWYRGEQPSGIFLFNLRTPQIRELKGGLFPRGWSSDGRFVFFQWPQSPVIYRLDASGRREPEVVVKPPFRYAHCTPVGRARPDTFLCAVFDLVSDIWEVENFDPHPA